MSETKEKDKRVDVQKREIKLQKGKKSNISKAVKAFGALLLAGKIMACEGYTDLSSKEVDDTNIVQYDAGYKDAGLSDVGHRDVGIVVDGSQEQDAGNQCISAISAKVFLKLSVAGAEVIVEMGNKVKIGDKEYTAVLSSNSGDLLLKDEDGNITIIPKGKAEVVNGRGVKFLDQMVDKTYYTSRVLLKAVSGDEAIKMILGEDGTNMFKIGEFDVELTSINIESWDEGGDAIVANLRVITPDYVLIKEGVRIGKNGYMVKTESGELALIPLEFGNELYPLPDAPKDLCEKTSVRISVLVNDRDKKYSESSTIVVSKNISLKLGKAFIGLNQNNTFVEAEVHVAGKEPERGLYPIGQTWRFTDGTETYTVVLGNIDFKTVSLESNDGGPSR